MPTTQKEILSELWKIREVAAEIRGMLGAMEEIASQNKEINIDMSCSLGEAKRLSGEIRDNAENLQDEVEDTEIPEDLEES